MKPEKLISIELPKWAQMVVTGKQVTQEQALEIIRRTDTFFLYQQGPNQKLTDDVIKITNLPREEGNREYYEQHAEWAEKWGYIETPYMVNKWISSGYIFGTHGWCHPDGRIGFIDDVGKYVTPKNVFEDLELLAGEFPFLELGVSLFDEEQRAENKTRVISFEGKNGEVKIVDPETKDVHEGHPEAIRKKDGERYFGEEYYQNAEDMLYQSGSDIPLKIIEQWVREPRRNI